ncbi:Putative ribonuclease H protein, partial [Glycine soja]
YHPYTSLIHRIINFKTRQWNLTFQHIYREGNQCPDFLANQGFSSQASFHPLETIPSLLKPLLLADANSTSFL